MKTLLNEFVPLLENREKEKCIQFCLEHLSDGSLDVVSLYENILAPSLNTPSYGPGEEDVNIWEEHSRTSIVRTIIESCYTWVVKERDERYKSTQKGTVIVLCPSEEPHEIGARMVADFFTLTGFEVTFIGASTPGDQVLDALDYFKPDYVAISITNAYNLIATGRMVKKILDLKIRMDFKVILGGRACRTNNETCRRMNPDFILNTFEDIRKLAEGDSNVSV